MISRAFLRWCLSRRSPPLFPEAGDEPVEVVPLLPESLTRPAQGFRIAWLGHSSIHLTTARGLRIMVDPIFGAPPLKRRLAPPPIVLEALLPVHLLLLTHDHYDHLDVPTIQALAAGSPELVAFVPMGLGKMVRRLGVKRVLEFAWWEWQQIEETGVWHVPMKHWSGRGPFSRGSGWGGWVLETGNHRVLLAGDTGWGPHFDAIASKLPEGFSAAVLPIGAYSPPWFMRDNHMNPPEAVRAARRIGARMLLPVHWGTFRLSEEPLGEPPLYLERMALAAGQPVNFWRPGETYDA